jgi:thymidylate synthase
LKLAQAMPSPRGALFDLRAEDIGFEGYEPWPAIRAPVAI